MNKERRVGRRSVVQNRVKLTPEFNNENQFSKGPKKALFDKTMDDDFAISRRSTLKPLYEFSLPKSISHEKLNDKTIYETSSTQYLDMFNKHNQIPVSPPSRTRQLQSSIMKNCRMPKEPVLQSKELYNTLIDSPRSLCEKARYDNALSSASKFLLKRHLDSVKSKANLFNAVSPNLNMSPFNENHMDSFKLPNSDNLNSTKKQNVCQTNCETQTSNVPLLVEEIEELKKIELEEIHFSKLKCCDLIKTRFREIELEIENLFGVLENKVTQNYDKLLKKIHDENNDSADITQTSIETVKEKNYTRMTGAFGILNNLNSDCSFLKTPKTKGKTREEMLSKGILTPCTMSFVLQEQLMNLNSNT